MERTSGFRISKLNWSWSLSQFPSSVITLFITHEFLESGHYLTLSIGTPFLKCWNNWIWIIIGSEIFRFFWIFRFKCIWYYTKYISSCGILAELYVYMLYSLRVSLSKWCADVTEMLSCQPPALAGDLTIKSCEFQNKRGCLKRIQNNRSGKLNEH